MFYFKDWFARISRRPSAAPVLYEAHGVGVVARNSARVAAARRIE